MYVPQKFGECMEENLTIKILSLLAKIKYMKKLMNNNCLKFREVNRGKTEGDMQLNGKYNGANSIYFAII